MLEMQLIKVFEYLSLVIFILPAFTAEAEDEVWIP